MSTKPHTQTDHQQAAKILHKIIDTHYLTIQLMNDNSNNEPATQSEPCQHKYRFYSDGNMRCEYCRAIPPPLSDDGIQSAISDKGILLQRLSKVIQTIVDADYACFEKPRLEAYRKQLAEQKRGIELIIALVKTDPQL